MAAISGADNAEKGREEDSILDTWVYEGKKLGDMTKEDLLRAAENERAREMESAKKAAFYTKAADLREVEGDA